MAKQRIIGKVEKVAKKWLSKNEACAYIGCSEKFLKTLRNNADITFAQYGTKMYWYDLESIDRFIRRNIVYKELQPPR